MLHFTLDLRNRPWCPPLTMVQTCTFNLCLFSGLQEAPLGPKTCFLYAVPFMVTSQLADVGFTLWIYFSLNMCDPTDSTSPPPEVLWFRAKVKRHLYCWSYQRISQRNGCEKTTFNDLVGFHQETFRL